MWRFLMDVCPIESWSERAGAVVSKYASGDTVLEGLAHEVRKRKKGFLNISVQYVLLRTS